MSSTNFEPLKEAWPQLYEYADSAESFVYLDPHTAVLKLRCFCEYLVGIIYRDLNLPSDAADGFFERVKSAEFELAVKNNVRKKLHSIRLLGNSAAHCGDVSSEQACAALRDAYLIGRWLHGTLLPDSDEQEIYPDYILPDKAESLHASRAHSLDEPVERQKGVVSELARLGQSECEDLGSESRNQEQPDRSVLDSFGERSTWVDAKIEMLIAPTPAYVTFADAFSGYELTGDQQELVQRLDVFLHESDDSVFILGGYAGTGKTFIAKGLIDYFLCTARDFALAAPTGKAAKVLSQKTGVLASTIHKLIYVFSKEEADQESNGEEGSQQPQLIGRLRDNQFDADSVYIIDEASMISDDFQHAGFAQFGSGKLLSDLMDFVGLQGTESKAKAIFVGDTAQLPPVKAELSPALDRQYFEDERHLSVASYEMTDVVRQLADSGVMNSASSLRDAIRTGDFSGLCLDLDSSDVCTVSWSSLIDAYMESCDHKVNGESIIIAHSNAHVAKFNQQVRARLFPHSREVCRGDKLLVVKNTNSAYDFQIFNGDFGFVRWVDDETEVRTIGLSRVDKRSGKKFNISVALRFKNIEVGFRDEDDRPRFFSAYIFEDLLYRDKPGLTYDENQALQVDFKNRNRELKPGTDEYISSWSIDPYVNALQVKFGYAITCHKAQGSEWNNVFVKCDTVHNESSIEYCRWLYTAITRTKSNLFLLRPPFARRVQAQVGANRTVETALREPLQGVSSTPAPAIRELSKS